MSKTEALNISLLTLEEDRDSRVVVERKNRDMGNTRARKPNPAFQLKGYVGVSGVSTHGLSMADICVIAGRLFDVPVGSVEAMARTITALGKKRRRALVIDRRRLLDSGLIGKPGQMGGYSARGYRHPHHKPVVKIAGPVTEAMILAAMTPSGGWTKAQLREWGVPWPPPAGWKERLIHSTAFSEPRNDDEKMDAEYRAIIGPQRT